MTAKVKRYITQQTGITTTTTLSIARLQSEKNSTVIFRVSPGEKAVFAFAALRQKLQRIIHQQAKHHSAIESIGKGKTEQAGGVKMNKR